MNGFPTSPPLRRAPAKRFDIYADVYTPGEGVSLIARDVANTEAYAFKQTLEKQGWRVEMHPATAGPQARYADRDLQP